MTLSVVLMGLSVLGGGFSLFMLLRNEMVWKFRKRVIDESEFDEEIGKIVPYYYMVDYDHMMWHGWFTGLEPFLDDAKEKQRQVHLARVTGQE